MFGKGSFILALLTISIAYYVSRSRNKSETITVTCKSGSVRGFVSKSRDGRDYYSWLGIPYAKAPVKELRFADPEPVLPWDQTRDGSNYGSACTHFAQFPVPGLLTGDEDCLFLNVHAPKLMSLANQKKKLSVIFYIHGGAYVGGSGDQYTPDYFMDEDVIFVTVNYRLGIFGFLTTGDTTVRGNMGLKDLTQALKWVHENIESFGGDPKSVTILGTSAGAAAVQMLTLSKLSKGLFHRAIAESGAASNPWGYIPLDQSLQKLKNVTATLNCPVEDSTAIVECLRKTDARELLSVEHEIFTSKMPLLNPHLHGLGFLPTTEAVDDIKAFITEHPLKIIAKGGAHRIPILTGHTTGEGITAAVAFRQDEEMLRQFEENIIERTAQHFQVYSEDATKIAEKLIEFYMPASLRSKLSAEERIQNYTNLLGDAFFNFDIREAANLQRKFAPVYYYYYTNENGPSLVGMFYRMKRNWPMWLSVPYAVGATLLLDVVLGLPPLSYGIDHVQDVALLFGFPPLLFITEGHKHYQISKDHVRLMVDFTKDDKNVFVRGTKLLPLDKQGPLNLFEINEETRIVREPLEHRMNFLHSLNLRGVNAIQK